MPTSRLRFPLILSSLALLLLLSFARADAQGTQRVFFNDIGGNGWSSMDDDGGNVSTFPMQSTVNVAEYAHCGERWAVFFSDSGNDLPNGSTIFDVELESETGTTVSLGTTGAYELIEGSYEPFRLDDGALMFGATEWDLGSGTVAGGAIASIAIDWSTCPPTGDPIATYLELPLGSGSVDLSGFALRDNESWFAFSTASPDYEVRLADIDDFRADPNDYSVLPQAGEVEDIHPTKSWVAVRGGSNMDYIYRVHFSNGKIKTLFNGSGGKRYMRALWSPDGNYAAAAWEKGNCPQNCTHKIHRADWNGKNKTFISPNNQSSFWRWIDE